jgi:hypothetical protein
MEENSRHLDDIVPWVIGAVVRGEGVELRTQLSVTKRRMVDRTGILLKEGNYCLSSV